MAEYVKPEIKGVIGEEPNRVGEFPLTYHVGYRANNKAEVVTHITEDSTWFHVWADKHLVAKMNVRYVAAVLYKEKTDACNS